MGVLFKATDIRLNRPVVLKFLPTHLTTDADVRQRFIQEAQAAAALSHPHIVTVHEIDEWEGQTYIAMEYIEGRTLKDVIAEAAREGILLAFGDVISTAVQVAEGLQAAHEAGIVHRDVKPANVIISKRGEAKLIDFGLAKLAGQVRLTQSGSTMGTAAYMAPEQVRGEAVDNRSDIWSLGAMLYELYTGHLPFPGENAQAVMHAILEHNPSPLTRWRPEAPRALQEIVDRCLDKKTNQRYSHARELAADLRTLLTDIGEKTDRIVHSASLTSPAPHAPPPEPGAPLSPKKKGAKKFIIAAAAAVVIALLLFIGPSAWRRQASGVVPKQKYLAVLPLAVIGGDRSTQAFGDGLVETLTSMLTQFEQSEQALWIVPASELRSSGITSPSRARKALGVNLAITGSLQHSGGSMRLTLNVVDTAALRQLRSTVLTERITSSAGFQDRAVVEVARMLDLTLAADVRARLTAGGTSQPAANEFYLQGRGFLQRYEQQENLDMAISLFQRAVLEDPRFALAFAGLGEANWRKYELTKNSDFVQEAEENCRRAIELDDQLVPVRITLGIIERGRGFAQQAIASFRRALELDPVNSEALLELAIAFEEVGKLKEAEATYRQAIALKPTVWSAYNNLGVFYYLNGRLGEAETMFRRVVTLTPDNIRGFNNLGVVFLLQGKVQQAREAFEKSLVIRPNADAYSNLGTILYYQGRFREAAAMYENGIALGRDDYQMWGNLGDAYRNLPGSGDKARQAYQTAIELAAKQLPITPADAHLHSSLALYSAKGGQRERSLNEIAQALNLAGRDLTVLFNAALVYELGGMRQQALDALKNYAALSGSLAAVDQDPFFLDLRRDPRYGRIIEKKPENKN